jgi:hypothetical protein
LRKALIVILIVTLHGCSVAHYTTVGNGDQEAGSDVNIIENVRSNNICEENFFIEKGEITINRGNDAERFLFTVKYNKPGIWLISIRNFAGLEGARIYLSGDTVLINDRIGKRVLFGKAVDLEKLTGFSSLLINSLFGDLILPESREKPEIVQNNNKYAIIQNIQGKSWKSVIDMNKGKVAFFSLQSSGGKEILKIKYSKFSRAGRHIPRAIELNETSENLIASIRLKRMQIPWTGDIEFISGKGYSKERIK